MGRLDRLPLRALPGGLMLYEARSRGARLLGLALLGSLPPGRGLLLPGCRSVHTFGMRFALDLVFLDEAGRAVELVQGVAPWRVVSRRRARGVVETGVGDGRRFLVALALERARSPVV